MYDHTLQSFAGNPSVFVSAKYTRDTKPDDAMYIWTENVKAGSFEVCIREFLPFDGKHQDTIVVGTLFSIIFTRAFNSCATTTTKIKQKTLRPGSAT